MNHYDTRFWTARKLARCRQTLRRIAADPARPCELRAWAEIDLMEVEAVLAARQSVEAYDAAVVARRRLGLPLHDLGGRV